LRLGSIGAKLGMARRQLDKLRADLTFKDRQFTAEVMLWAVRWYLMFSVSYITVDKNPAYSRAVAT
jgi:hypothetical protein